MWRDFDLFFQAEDGIRDDLVTGVQTCALPILDSMIASRLVVDTGMNALGWSRERASQFLRENTILSDAEIATETLRYAVDIPAQALAYKIGSNQMLALRRGAKERLVPKFDIRQ